MVLKFRTPVVCQNGHKAFWYWEIDDIDIGHTRYIGVPSGFRCSCPKQGLGEGYARAGADQMFTGWRDRDASPTEIYEGDIVVASYHWTEYHVVTLPDDFYDVMEFALADDLSIRGNVFMNPEEVKDGIKK